MTDPENSQLTSPHPGSTIHAVKASAEQHDPLTGLLTRDSLKRSLEAALASVDVDGGFALLLINLDRFKDVNRSLGHPIGDMLLIKAARRLRLSIRKIDQIARVAGDEFAVLARLSPDTENLQSFAARVLELLGRPYVVQGHQIDIGASIGIALAPADGGSWDELQRAADLALHRSKQSAHSRCCFFDPSMASMALTRRSLEVDLRRAFAMQQLELYYQPQIDGKSQELLGFEALLRWRHPEKGLVPPSDFILVAEQIGLIVQIGDWVLRTACKEASSWPTHLSVAVNVSPLQFDADHLVRSVRSALESSNLPGSRLELEITEGALLSYDESVVQTLYELKALGVHIAMDDFGTGFASLSQLVSFPFDKIKIDQSFLRNQGAHPGKRAIIKAIAALGTGLGFYTMAEGVETTEQLAQVRLDGCDSIQGYFYSKPVPAAEVETLIDALKRFQDS